MPVKIALVGAAYEDTASASRPGDLVFGPTIPAVLAGAKSARAAGADLVIAIMHAGKATGAALMNTHAVDLIVSEGSCFDSCAAVPANWPSRGTGRPGLALAARGDGRPKRRAIILFIVNYSLLGEGV